MSFDVGDSVRLEFEVRDTSGTLVDAASTELTVTLPDATTVTPAVSSPSVGTYVADYTATQAGRHLARWVATDPDRAFTDAFDVRPEDPPYIISLADAKEQLNFTDRDSDEELRAFLEAGTRVVERHRNEVIARRTVTDYRTVAPRRTLMLRSVPVISLTSVETVDGETTWNIADIHVDPVLGKLRVLDGPSLVGDVEVIYVAGYQVVPAHYTLAVRMIVDHLWETQRGQTGATRFMTTEDVTSVPGFNFAVPRKALELLGDQVPTLA